MTNNVITEGMRALLSEGEPPKKKTAKSKPAMMVSPSETVKADPMEEAKKKELDKFANWMGEGADVKQYAHDLGRRGLHGATDMVLDTSPDSKVPNNLSVWKPALIQRILSEAKKRGYNAEQLMVDKENILKLSGGEEAINHPLFTRDKDNFWGVVKGLYGERLSKM